MVEEVRKLLLQCGISSRPDEIALISQLIFGYLSKRSDGHRILYKLLKMGGFKASQASYLKTYYKEGYYGMDDHKLPFDKLELLQLWFYNGQNVVPFDMVEVKEQPDHVACDDCGILSPIKYCSQPVVEIYGGKERLLNLCNHCRMYKEDPKIRDTAKRANCEDCKLQSCLYWKEFHKPKELFDESPKAPSSLPSPRPQGSFVSPMASQLDQRPPAERYGGL